MEEEGEAAQTQLGTTEEEEAQQIGSPTEDNADRVRIRFPPACATDESTALQEATGDTETAGSHDSSTPKAVGNC